MERKRGSNTSTVPRDQYFERKVINLQEVKLNDSRQKRKSQKSEDPSEQYHYQREQKGGKK